ncbi:MAG: hypothetical protein OHK0012_17740 [Synechococcales cyanobacterium]
MSSIQPRRIARELALLGAGQLSGLGKGSPKRLEDVLVAAVRAVKEDVHDVLTQAAADVNRAHQLLTESEHIVPDQSAEVGQLRQRLQHIHQQAQRLVRRGLTLDSQSQLQQWAQELQVNLENAVEYTEKLEQQLYSARHTLHDAATQCQSGINHVGAALTLPDLLMLSQGEEVKTYALKLLESLQRHQDQIDPLLETHLVSWSLARLGQVERTILRLAVLEMHILKSVPAPVAVNEAVELAKKYGSHESPTFINGVLRRFLNQQLMSVEPVAD